MKQTIKEYTLLTFGVCVVIGVYFFKFPNSFATLITIVNTVLLIIGRGFRGLS